MEVKRPTAQDVEDSISAILKRFDDPTREGLIDTPKRATKALLELLTADEPKITVFDSNGYNQMIIESGIEYYSLCEHHLLPFFGEVKIGYIPNGKIIGLSKLSRIVEYFSKHLNTQEYFTQNIADYLQDKLDPVGVGVIVTGRHLCKEMRGVKKKGIMTTTALKGAFFINEVKSEFLKC